MKNAVTTEQVGPGKQWSPRKQTVLMTVLTLFMIALIFIDKIAAWIAWATS